MSLYIPRTSLKKKKCYLLKFSKGGGIITTPLRSIVLRNEFWFTDPASNLLMMPKTSGRVKCPSISMYYSVLSSSPLKVSLWSAHLGNVVLIVGREAKVEEQVMLLWRWLTRWGAGVALDRVVSVHRSGTRWQGRMLKPSLAYLVALLWAVSHLEKKEKCLHPFLVFLSPLGKYWLIEG